MAAERFPIPLLTKSLFAPVNLVIGPEEIAWSVEA
jgi:hypothetical protein